MAKKAVAAFGAKGIRKEFCKNVYVWLKSSRSGAYSFQEEMVPIEGEKDFFSKK